MNKLMRPAGVPSIRKWALLLLGWASFVLGHALYGQASIVRLLLLAAARALPRSVSLTP